MKSGFVESDKLEWLDLGDGISRQIYSYDETVMMVRVKFETGAIGTLHSHPHRQSSYVASGKFEVSIDGENMFLSAGDGFMVLPDQIHGCKCLEEGVLVDVFVPMRKDFL